MQSNFQFSKYRFTFPSTPTSPIPPPSRSSCQCQRVNNLCPLAFNWLSIIYPSTEIPKLKSVFSNYLTNKKIPLSHLIPIISSDIDSIKISYPITQKQQKEIQQILLCFAKHNHFYQRKQYLTIYAWLAAALVYHADTCTAFWVLDGLCDVFKLGNQHNNLQNIADKVYSRISVYFGDIKKRVENQKVQLRGIVRYLVSDLMLSYIPMEYASFLMIHVLEKGSLFFEKLVLSYLDKRFEVVKKKGKTGKQILTTCILNNQDEWPIIFCGMNSFKLESN